jgi:hypothetical protein
MTRWTRVSGDVNDTVVVYLYNVTGAPTTSKSHVADADTATNLDATTVVGVDPRGKSCLVHTIQLGTWLQNLTPPRETAVYDLEHEVSFADGRTLTWPGDFLFIRRASA